MQPCRDNREVSSGDTIRIDGLRVFGHHGDLAAERELGVMLTVDLELETDLAPAGAADSLADTVDYVRSIGLVRDIVEHRQFHLIEGVAEAIAQALLEEEPRITAVRVRVAKQPAMAVTIDRVSVHVERSR